MGAVKAEPDVPVTFRVNDAEPVPPKTVIVCASEPTGSEGTVPPTVPVPLRVPPWSWTLSTALLPAGPSHCKGPGPDVGFADVAQRPGPAHAGAVEGEGHGVHRQVGVDAVHFQGGPGEDRGAVGR